jgi:uncharacterized protein YneF (UPF0154 family)
MVHIKKLLKMHVIALVFLIVVTILAVLTGAYYYLQYQKTQALLKNPSLHSQQEIQAVIQNIGRLIDLPTDEQPTVATVSDINKLKDQPFFSHAKNGDKVLIYTKAKKAILYDPVANKIIEVSTVNLGPASSENQSQAQASISIALYNGTSIVGLTTTVQKQLATEAPNVHVIAKANAATTLYSQTLVVDLTGKNAQATMQLSKTLHGVVGSLPEGEKRPDGADVLVILGKQSVSVSPTTTSSK